MTTWLCSADLDEGVKNLSGRTGIFVKFRIFEEIY